MQPAWVRKPSELTKEDYEKFYKELYPFNETPLFWIHLNVDYPFNLTGILYFPKIKQSYEIQKDKIQLYCNQVFVTDEVTLTVNGNHPVCKQILSMEDEAVRDSQVHNLADLALLSQGLLKGADLTAFIERSMSMLAPVK